MRRFSKIGLVAMAALGLNACHLDSLNHEQQGHSYQKALIAAHTHDHHGSVDSATAHTKEYKSMAQAHKQHHPHGTANTHVKQHLSA